MGRNDVTEHNFLDLLLLRVIVRRARMLLDSDAAYLTLIDEARQDTYMRVTDGIVTEVFKRVRLNLGAGLVGLVAQQERPCSAADDLTESPQQVR